MRSQEVRRGTRVKVREGHRTPEVRGLLGTVAQRWGKSDYTALLVRLEDERYEMFWHHELEGGRGGASNRPVLATSAAVDDGVG